MLGAVPAAGRLFVSGDDAVGAPAGVVLSHNYWERRFGGRKDVIGQAITVDNEPHTVIGVMSADDAGAVASILREAMTAIDPDLPLSNILTVEEGLAGDRWARRFTSTLFSIIAAIALGLTIGIGGGIAVSRILPAQMTGAAGSDPLTFGAVAVVLVLAALLAASLPARRAIRLDPVAALRAE